MDTDKKSFERDDLTRKIIQKAGMEQPSFNFTENIMGKILVSHSPEVFVYKPVISKNAWIISGVVIIGTFLALFLIPQTYVSEGNYFAKYVTPAQNVLNNISVGFFNKLSVLASVSWMAVVIAAGWLLFAADKFFRKMSITS